MDPNETLKQLRALLGGDHGGVDESLLSVDAQCYLTHLCGAEELWQALDQWLSKGGFLPIDWDAILDDEA